MNKDKAIEIVIAAFTVWECEFDIGDDWSEEHKARDMAVEALATEAIPIDWIINRIDDLYEYIGKWGHLSGQEAVINAKIHEVKGLVRLIYDWRVEGQDQYHED